MTAQSITGAVAAPRPTDRRLAGIGALLRKDATEWIRGRRAWIIAVITVLFMTLTAANSWILARIGETAGDGAVAPSATSMVPLDNLLAAIGAQVWVMAAIFAVGSLIVAERQSGTLSWVASKPVSRAAIWVSKWGSATGMLAVSAAIVPVVATVALVTVLYGPPSTIAVVGLIVGMIAVIAFFAAVGLAAGTVLPGQPAVIAAGFGVFAIVPLVTALLPFDATPFLPTSMLTWVPMLLEGAPVAPVTPVAYVVATAAVVAFGLNRMSRMEL